jgi:glutaconate CoA-transferase subunit B
MSDEPLPAEYMVVALARALRDGEWGACGAYSGIPMAAYRLARREHAPNLSWLCGGAGAINSHCLLTDSATSHRTWRRAEAIWDVEDIVDFQFGGWRRRPTVVCFGGIQVDAEGSVNLVGVGPYDALRVRGPGTVGRAFAAHFSRTLIYLNHHDTRTLCERVDHVSAPGHTALRRRHVRGHSHGPQLIVTPQAVFGFDAAGRAELRSITPGHSEAEVRERTGFAFASVPDLGETPPPTPAQLAILREEIDPLGVLREVRLTAW